jgi:hypothetical protein
VEISDKLLRISVEWLKEEIVNDLNKKTSITAQIDKNGVIRVLDTMYKDRFSIVVSNGSITQR